VGQIQAADAEPEEAFLSFYDYALPHVYGYLHRRCANPVLAEELTAETFLAAAGAWGRSDPPPLELPWIIGVARHKLADHWRRRYREDRRFSLLTEATTPATSDPWDATLDELSVDRVLDRLSVAQRAALTWRYFDDLPVVEVAALLGRTVHATEALLVRAREAFRRAYCQEEAGDA
jgi:RNA polymerase sigma-70 factor (ECF subfamily)